MNKGRKEKEGEHTNKNTDKSDADHRLTRRVRPGMSGTILAISTLVCGVLLGISFLYWQKGGYQNAKVGFYWLIFACVAFTVSVLSAYWYNIVKPARDVAQSGSAKVTGKPVSARSVTERTSISVKTANFTVFEVNKKTEALVTFVNSGNLLATNVRVYGHLELRDKPLEPNMPGAKEIGEEPSQDIVPQNGGTTIMPISSGSALTRHLLSLINSGSHQIYIWGIVTYEDAFGEHWTKYCMTKFGNSMNVVNCTNNNETDK